MHPIHPSHAIHQICLDYRQNHQFSGCVLIQEGEDVVYEGAFGLAHRGFAVPNRPDTRFDTASVTKLFTAVAVLKLVQDGQLSLTDPIHDLVDLKGTTIPQDVTVFHLLTHTSGIGDDADETAGESYSALFRDKPNYSIRTLQDFLPQFVHKEPYFPAGSGVRYNNCAFILLGLAIETVTGQDYRRFVKAEVFTPLGMTHSEFCAMDEPWTDAAEGYYLAADGLDGPGRWKKNIYSYPPIGSPDGGAFSTVGDLDRFLRGVRAGKVLDETHTAMLFSPQAAFSQASRWMPGAAVRQGFVFEFLQREDAILSVRKDGVNEGVGAMLAWYPQPDRTIVILSNQACDIWAMHRELENALAAHSSERG